jgi:Zn-dependent protease with chaperone function
MSSIGTLSRIGWSTKAATQAPLEQRARRFFAVNAALGAFTSLAAAVAVAGSVASVKLGAPAQRTAGLTVFGQHFGRPDLNLPAGLTLALALLGLVVVGLAAEAAVRELVASRRFLRAVAARRPVLRGDFFVFDAPAVQAFCAGLRRPEVYVSTGALRTLSACELEAVLAHERHHRRSHDPLRIATGRVLTKALFLVPVVGQLHRRSCAIAELAADEAAIAANRDGGRSLASAMLVFAAGAHPEAAVGIAPERVDQMVGRGPDWRLPLAVVASAFAAVALIAALAWQLAQLAVLQTTLNLPLLSAQPCIVILALLPSVALLVRIGHRHARRSAVPA